jgi:hypothetical protein
MISYENYKILHLVSIFVMFTGLSVGFFGSQPKLIKILTGVGTLFTLVAGMGLLARLGVQHGEPWPLWVWIKMIIWLLIGVGGAVVVKRFPSFGKYAYIVSLLLFVLAASSAILKF